MAQFDAAIARDPKPEDAWMWEGWALLEQGHDAARAAFAERNAAAIDVYHRLTTLVPDVPNDWYHLAELRAMVRDQQGAFERLRCALALDPALRGDAARYFSRYAGDAAWQQLLHDQ